MHLRTLRAYYFAEISFVRHSKLHKAGKKKANSTGAPFASGKHLGVGVSHYLVV